MICYFMYLVPLAFLHVKTWQRQSDGYHQQHDLGQCMCMDFRISFFWVVVLVLLWVGFCISKSSYHPIRQLQYICPKCRKCTLTNFKVEGTRTSDLERFAKWGDSIVCMQCSPSRVQCMKSGMTFFLVRALMTMTLIMLMTSWMPYLRGEPVVAASQLNQPTNLWWKF